MGFGFAQPLQRRLPMTGIQPAMPAAPGNIAPDPGPLSKTLDQVKAGLQRIGLNAPVPSPVGPIPTITSPAMPSGGGIEDPSGSIAEAAKNVADGFSAGGDAAAAGSDALAADGAGIGEFLAALFI